MNKNNLVLLGIGGAGMEIAKRNLNNNWILLDSDNTANSDGFMTSDEVNKVIDAISEFDSVLICVGLGGKFGSSITPKVIDLAKKQGKFVGVVAFMPFSFEGHSRAETAEKAFEEIYKKADYSVCVSNDSLSGTRKMSFAETFARGDLIVTETKAVIQKLLDESVEASHK